MRADRGALGPTEGSALLTGNTPKGSIDSVDSLSDETPDARESPTNAMDAPAYHGDGQAIRARSPRNVASETPMPTEGMANKGRQEAEDLIAALRYMPTIAPHDECPELFVIHREDLGVMLKARTDAAHYIEQRG